MKRHANIRLEGGPAAGLLLDQDDMPPWLDVLTVDDQRVRYRRTNEFAQGERIYRYAKIIEEERRP